MKKDLLDLITVDDSLAVPVYKQIVQSIIKGINDGLILQNDKLPSVNGVAERFSLARGSVFSAYNELRASGLVDSIPGKGYFITSLQTQHSQKIFLLFNSFSSDNESLYSSIVSHLPAGSKLDIFFHHQDEVLFENLIREKTSYYNSFVIMPQIHDNTVSVLSTLDPKQLLLLDGGYKEYKKHFSGVYQNYEKDLMSFLSHHPDLTHKYKRLFLVVADLPDFKDIIAGFKRYSKTTTIKTAIIDKVDTTAIRKGDAFIVINDQELVQLANCLMASHLLTGRDVGLLSYQETALKGAVAGGISTISPDYAAMGKSVAGMLISGDREVIENPCKVTDRQSF